VKFLPKFFEGFSPRGNGFRDENKFTGNSFPAFPDVVGFDFWEDLDTGGGSGLQGGLGQTASVRFFRDGRQENREVHAAGFKK